ncbi:15801_t:CDS:2 [Dentiscutata heterogama]|uniref:15801_t:CDS:1 n=1 Tax=Dentiscutata heterogama TaxID=1316150 RepID=A0ACA9KL74_9GLOM|nr:15801_t:CDS:2 [Dentiscutata heterogama]
MLTTSKRWSFHETLGKAGKTIQRQQRTQRKDSKNDSSIVSSSSGKIIMATIEKLIEKLTSGIDYTFLTDFFLTYRKFLTPIKLCKLLILRFDWALGGDDEERRIVRVRTFVAIRHWLLNYFAYDFIPCRALRTTLTKYLNSLPSHPLVKSSPRDQRIVQGLKRVIRRLKRMYYRKSAMDFAKKRGDMYSSGMKKLSGKNNEIFHKNINQEQLGQDLIGDKVVVDNGGGSGVSTSLIEDSINIAVSYDSSNYYTITQKQSNLLRHQSSSSSLDSTITPGTTDSESEAIDSYTPSISGVTRKETHQNIIYSSSSNSHTSDEDQTDELYGQKRPKYSSELGDDLYMESNVHEDEDDGAGVSRKKVQRTSMPEPLAIPIDQLKHSKRKPDNSKKRSNSMGDMSQRKLDIFNHLGDTINENENPLVVKEPPPLPPRRRRHTLDVSSASPSFFKSGLLKTNFPLKRPKKSALQEKIVDTSLPSSRGIARRNSSPAFIGSASSKTGNQLPGQEQIVRRPSARSSWPRKMSITVGKFAKGLFIGEKNKGSTQSGALTKCGGIQGDFRTMRFGRLSMLCASSSSASTEEIDSDLSFGDDVNPKIFNGDEYNIHVDGFSYVDESVEDEYYDTSHPEEFEITEQWYEQQSTQDDTNFESLTSSPIDLHLPTISTFSQDKQSDDDDILDILQQDYEESRNNRQTARATRRRAKMWHLVPVMEVEDDVDPPPQSSETDTYLVSQSSGSQKDDDLQPVRKQSYLESVSEVEEGGDTDPNISPQQSFEQEYEDEFYEEEPGDHHNIRALHHRLRRLPEVRDLRSVTNLKDLDEKSGKRVSWGTSSYGVEGSGAATDSAPDSLMSLSQSTSKTAPLSKRRGPTKDGSQEIGGRQRNRHTASRPSSKNSAEAITFEKDTNISRSGSVSRPKKSKHTTIHTHHAATTEPSVSQGPSSSFSSTAPSSRQLPYKSFILSYRSEAIAKQFCLIERDLLMQVRWEELVQVSWANGDKNKSNNTSDIEKDSNIQDIRKETKNDKGKRKEVESETDEEKVHVKPIKDGGVDKVIERFNQTIDWVATETILTHSLEDRVRVIEKFIRIAQKCLQLSNFATLNQILLGLQSPPVERLRRTWSRVRVAERRILKELNDYISPFDNWKIVRDAMRQIVEDSSAIKDTTKQRRRRGSDVKKTNTGCIPFLALYLSDLVFNAALPSFIEPASQPPSLFYTSTQLHQQPLVNFQKHRTTAAIIKRVIAFQSLACGYTFPIDADLCTKCVNLKAVEATRLVVMDLDVEDLDVEDYV